MANSPSKMQVEREHANTRREMDRISEENASLRTQLKSAEASREVANTRVDKLTADLRLAQATSSRLDREMKFQIEMQSELGRMKLENAPKTELPEEEKEKGLEDLFPSVVDQLQQQAEAIEKERVPCTRSGAWYRNERSLS